MDGTNLSRKMNVAEQRAQYDNNAKHLLAEKIVLAHILVHTVPEFRGMRPQDVIPLIEGTPQVAEVPVYPGESNMPSIIGDNTEDNVPYEGKVTYDVRFHVWTPDRSGKIKLIVDIEAQKDFAPGYDIVTRAIFYSSRLISAQKGTEFVKSDYNKIKKVYTIWICMDTPEYAKNTITSFHMKQENIVGNMPEGHFRFDIPNVILVCLSDELAGETDELKLHRLLGILFSDSMPVDDRKKMLEKEYDISMTENMERRTSGMCNLSEAIWEKGIKQGIEQGVEQGINKEKERIIVSLHEKGMSVEFIMQVADVSQEELDKIIAGRTE